MTRRRSVDVLLSSARRWDLVLPTSVSTACGLTVWARASTDASALTGVAATTRSAPSAASSTEPARRVIASRSKASRSSRRSRSAPTTSATPAALAARPTEAPSSPVPTIASRPGHLPVVVIRSLREVVAQVLGAVQVDVAQARPRAGRVAVDQDPDGVRVAAGHVQLAGAEQRHVAEAERAGGQRRELAAEVVGRGEDDGDELVVLDVVAFQQGGQQLAGPVQQRLAGVAVHGGRTTQRDQPLGGHRPP